MPYQIYIPMIKKIVILTAMLFSAFFYAQERIYIDSNGNPVSKEEAELYREVTEKEGIYHIKDFYLNGQLQMEGYSQTLEVESITDFIGKYTFYYENGKIEVTGEVQDGKSIQAKGYDEKGRLTYEEKHDGEGVESKSLLYADDYFPYNQVNLRKKDGSYKQIIYDQDINKIRVEQIEEADLSVKKIDYYDIKGKLIGTLTYTDTYEPRGMEVSYYYKPMRVKSITRWNDKGEAISEESYYPNGKIFSKKDMSKTTIFYNEKGKKIGELTYKADEDGIEFPYEGSEYTLNEEGILTSKTEYKLGNYVTTIHYYKNKKEKSKLEYNLDELPSKITFYTPKGQVKSALSYNDGMPYQGIYYADLEKNDAYTSYREGTLIEQKNYDDQKILRYSKTLLEDGAYSCQIYNEKGQRVYEYTIDDDQEMKIFQLENGKTIRAATIKRNLITEGSLLYKDSVRTNETIIIERQAGWIIIKNMLDDKLVKETKINAKYIESDNCFGNYYIHETTLSEFAKMSEFAQ